MLHGECWSLSQRMKAAMGEKVVLRAVLDFRPLSEVRVRLNMVAGAPIQFQACEEAVGGLKRAVAGTEPLMRMGEIF